MAVPAGGHRDLVHVLDAWTNTPLLCRADYGMKAAAVLSGRLNIASIRSDFTDIGRAEMEAIAGQARIEATADKAREKPGTNLEVVGNIAVIQVYGALTRTWGVGPYSGSTGYDGILVQLEEAVSDDEIEGIWLDVRSNGGTIDYLYELMDTIYSLRESQGGTKPIWGMASSFAYSAAYGLLSSCDKCFMPPAGGVGSIGVITMHTSYARQNEMEGIDVTVMRWPELKAKATEDEKLDEDTYKRTMAQLAYFGGMFQTRVARNMGISLSAVAETKGLDYVAPEALAIGLVSDVLPEAVVWENFRREIARRR